MAELTNKEMGRLGGKRAFETQGLLGIKQKVFKSNETRFKLGQISEPAYLATKERLTREIEELSSNLK